MKPEESKSVEKLGRKAFQGFESLFVSKPKDVLIAESEGRILGAVLYKFYQTGKKKIGYVDFAFTDPEFHGRGIGKQLYTKTIELLWDLGCDAISALVKDDNVGSWKLFLDNDFSRVSLGDITRYLGFGGMLKQYFGTPFCIATGMEYYLALKDTTIKSKIGYTSRQIVWFFLVNVLLFSSASIFNGTAFPYMLAGMFVLLGIRVLAGYIGTFFSKESWRFRMTNGGGLISLLVNIVGVFPMVGNWYPEIYSKAQPFRKAMGTVALAQWKVMFLISLISYTSIASHTFFKLFSQLAMALAIYSVIPFYPFDSFGGKRLYKWNKGIYFVCLILTALSFFGHFF
jgi:L-amino acid N-acyltransferase YncA